MDFYNIKESMKRLFSVLIACVSGLLITAGSEVLGFDKAVDWALVHFVIEATDAEGNSIISPDMPGMTLSFQGVTYVVRNPFDPQTVQTKAYLAQFGGFYAQLKDDEDGKDVYYLVFGEIDGASDMDEDIVLCWPDGSKDEIHYHCSDHRIWPEPKCNRSWKLNGENHEGNVFQFVGKSSQ